MATATKTKKQPTPASLDPALVEVTSAPVESIAQEESQEEVKTQPKIEAPKVEIAPIEKKSKRKKNFLDLGAGYKIAHKPGTTYSIFYRLLAEKSHFAEIATLLEAGKSNLNDKEQAKELLEKLTVPISDLQEAFEEDSERKIYARRKTKRINTRAKSGERHAKQMLKKGNRLEKGRWVGNLEEVISMCLGYYNLLAFGTTKKQKTNRNIEKFREAGIVIRRFPLVRGKALMMFPQKFIDQVKTAILTVKGTNEDAN